MAARYAKLSKIFVACTEIWHKRPIPLHQKQKKNNKKTYSHEKHRVQP